MINLFGENQGFIVSKNDENKFDRRYRKKFDYILLIMVYVLIVLGVLFVAVATYNPDITLDLPLSAKIIHSNTASWQAIFMLASPIVLWIIVGINYSHFKRLGRLAYIVVIGLLLVAFLQRSIRNVSAWISAGFDRMIQPAEFAKLVIILTLADVLSKDKKPLSTRKNVIEVFALLGFPALITLMQKETGSVIVMGAIFLTMLYFSDANWRWWAGIVLIGAVGVGLILVFAFSSGSESYKFQRILAFLDPVKYAGSDGLQLLTSQEAIGSGGLNGIGFFKLGSHSQLNFVPEDWTDFIFATIGEAVGFYGCIAIIVLYLLIIFRMLYLAKYTIDTYGRLIIYGVVGMLYYHIFQNIAMTIGLMPITGIPLPFLSYGGSNFITNLTAVGFVLNVTKNRPDNVSRYSFKLKNEEDINVLIMLRRGISVVLSKLKVKKQRTKSDMIDKGTK